MIQKSMGGDGGEGGTGLVPSSMTISGCQCDDVVTRLVGGQGRDDNNRS